MRYEKGKCPVHNVSAIVSNVKLVFKSGDINKLNGTAYRFIITHMGFIAHYDLYGFRDTYQDLNQFAKALQTSEYSESYDYNPRRADEVGAQTDEYGPGYNKSVSDTIRGIIAIAQDYLNYGGLDKDYNYSALDKRSKPKTKTTRRTHSHNGEGAIQMRGVRRK